MQPKDGQLLILVIICPMCHGQDVAILPISTDNCLYHITKHTIVQIIYVCSLTNVLGHDEKHSGSIMCTHQIHAQPTRCTAFTVAKHGDTETPINANKTLKAHSSFNMKQIPILL